MPIGVVKITHEPKADSHFASVVPFNGALTVAERRARYSAGNRFPKFKARVPSDDRGRTRDSSFAFGIERVQTQQPHRNQIESS